jgi:hypothetical protein
MAYAEVFEAFFRNADVDHDGRISGVEAINFFRAADLPQPTLAKVRHRSKFCASSCEILSH